MPCGAVLPGRLPETAVGMQDRFAYNGKENVMKKIRVGVAGYGTIGQRLADGVALQEDREFSF